MNPNRKEVLILRFFSYSFNHFPKLSYFFVFFLVAQGLLNVIKLEATPLFLFGMYSEKVPYSPIHRSTAVYVNGRNLDSLKIPYRKKDLLRTTLEHYRAMKENGGTDPVQTRVESRYPFFTHSFVYPLVQERIYNHPEDLARYEAWFRQKCRHILQEPVTSVQLIDHYYAFTPHQPFATLVKSEPVVQF